MPRVVGIGVVVWCALAPMGASAHQATFVLPTQHDVIDIVDPILSQAHYGELTDFPHTYEFTLEEPTTIFAEILVPDIDTAANDKSGLLLEVLPRDKGVREVARLTAKDATWESFYEWFGGDTYRRGSSFYNSLEAGTYRLEVSTPINKGKYVLVVGKREEGKGYVATVKDIARVKTFFEKPRIAVLQSPFVYVPVVVLLFVGLVVFRLYRRRFVK